MMGVRDTHSVSLRSTLGAGSALKAPRLHPDLSPLLAPVQCRSKRVTCTLLCSYNKISAEGAVAVFEVVSCLGSVGELLMDGNRIGDAFACMNRATNLASLRILSLRANRIRVLDCMPFLPSLKTLLLDGNQIGDSFELNCLSNSCPSVERLSLSWCSIHNISRVCSALRGLTKLRVLALQQVSQVLFP
jgi:Leucine-rich repeat (LRR) protein